LAPASLLPVRVRGAFQIMCGDDETGAPPGRATTAWRLDPARVDAGAPQ